MIRHIRLICIVLIVFLFSKSVYPQSGFTSESDLKKQATKLFEDDAFEEAFPLYSQLTSIYPKDPNYNYRLGVCMLFATEDKEKPIPFLEFASKNKEVEKEVLYYLAKAYHLNYRFDDAIKMYQNYKSSASSSKAQKLQVDRQIEMCNNGKQLLRNLTDLMVIDKKEMNRSDFFRAYDISSMGGKLLVKPDDKEFKTSYDVKKKEYSIIYRSANSNLIFFSSYGEDGKNGKELYSIKMKDNGDWEQAKLLGVPINTPYDEDFPFLHPNGKDLYFCSKGHNSMGGYDIFKSTFNEQTSTWGAPVNLDFPINTPDDDIMYVTDLAEKEAYFSSARASATGKTAVYKINVERKPIDIAVISGKVIKNRDDQKLDVKITVKDLNDNSILGIYNSKPEDGSYSINLPNGGKFMFTVESPGFDTQSEIVVLTTLKEFKPIKQEITYLVEKDKLQIKNIIDGNGDDSNYLMALKFIREKAKMDVNMDDFVANKDATETNKTEDATLKLTNKLSNEDIVKIAQDDAKETDTESKEIKTQAEIALKFANQKNEIAQIKNNESKQLFADASTEMDNVKKQSITSKANEKYKEAEALNNETVAAYNIAHKLEYLSELKQKEADLATQYAKDLESAVKSKSSAQALTKLEEQQKKLEQLSKENTGTAAMISSLKIDADNKKKELDKSLNNVKDIKQEIADNELVINNLNSDFAKASNESLKSGIKNQIEELKTDNVEKQKELSKTESKVLQLQKEYNGMLNESLLMVAVVNQSKTGVNELDVTAFNVSSNESVAPIVPNKENSKENVTLASTTTLEKDERKKNDIPSVNSVKKYEGELAALNSISNELEKETKKAEVLTNWTSSLKEEIVVKQKELKTEKDITKQKAIANSISSIENEIKDKQSLIAISNGKVEKIKQEQSNVANKQVATTNSEVANKDQSQESINNNDYDSKIASDLITADTIKNELVKATKKAALYKSWTTSISDEINLKQTALKSEKDATKKKELTATITKLTNELKEKEELIATSSATVEKIKQEQVIAINNGNTLNKTETNNTKSTITSNNSTDFSKNNSDYGSKISSDLISTDTIKNELSKATRKAELYKKWTVAITDEINLKQTALKSEKDATKKKELTATITKLTNELKEKEELIAASSATVEKIKQEQVIAINNGNTLNKTETNNTKSTITSNNSTDFSKNNSDYGSKISSDLISTDTIKNELSKATRKAELYKKWTVAITEEINLKQTALKSEKDATKKKELTESISKLIDDLKDKEGLMTASNTKIEQVKQEQTLGAGAKEVAKTNLTIAKNESTPTSNQQSSVESTKVYNEKFADELTLADTIKNVLLKETKKEELYKRWTASISDEIVIKKTALNREKNIEKEKELTAQITQLEKSLNQKQELRDSVLSSIKIIESAHPELAVGNSANEVGNSQQKANNKPTTNEQKQAFIYTYSQSKQDFEKVNTINKEVDDLKKQNEELKTKIEAEKNVDSRNKLFQESESVTKLVNDKKIESANTIGIANNEQFEVNQKQLNTFVEATSNTDLDEISIAEMMNDEAKFYFDKAEKIRIQAKSTDAFAYKESLLQDANTNELIALEKQRKALEIYVKNKNNIGLKKSDISKANAKQTNSKTLDTPKIVLPQTTQPSKLPTEIPSVKTTTNEIAKNDTVAKDQKIENTIKTPIVENLKQDSSTTTSVVVIPPKQKDTAKYEMKIVIPTDSAKTMAKVFASNDSSVINISAPNQGKKETIKKQDSLIVTSRNQSLPILLKNEIFERKSTTTYSIKKPIPVNEKLPEGLIFKVQIGAFQNPIPQDLFKGISPITGETTTKGFTRYTAGLFVKYSNADIVKSEIRNIGYKDAFVVAFLNGQRISLNQALNLTNETSNLSSNALSSEALKANVTSSNQQSLIVNSTNTTNSTNSTNPTIEQSSNKIESGEKVVSQNVKSLEGLFYTVQVGVYSQPVTSDKLFNIRPLYDEVTASGQIRYNSGVYNSIARAIEAKTMAIDVGIKDAFVVAYLQGKRISVQEAKQLETEGKVTFTTATNINVLPVFGSSGTTTVQKPINNEVAKQTETNKLNDKTVNSEVLVNTQLTTTIQPSKTENTQQNEQGVLYKVQIGAFKDEVPIEIANKFLSIANKGVNNYEDEKGLTIYTVGSFDSYEAATSLKSEMVANDIPDAFVVAYNQGKKITIEEAKQLNKK